MGQISRILARADGMSSAQLTELADTLAERVAHRGIFVQLSAALVIRELRRKAAQEVSDGH